MSEAWQPTLDDITKAFMDLAGRVSNSNGAALDPYVHQALRDVAFHLELYIPGLELPPDGEIAGALARASQAALDRGDCPDSLAHALRGLAHSPHDPGLFYLVASACFEYGAVELAIRMLYHTLWINPGHRAARADFESLSAFLDDAPGEGRAA
ncbi:MAG: hypothetical protein E6K73_12805 [Candidatus Eisenbacteria bacterium]|uniref:Tetratricopeptide repeat protein n=1 Tax=Eiseniibacteriota bacterium TaxID=2212470 RepID=A0A538S9F6_UNCEI|nr:MAG: hypothetical protein E6K73_12805 [Candidatus Eisenbacteria bacterium]